MGEYKKKIDTVIVKPRHVSIRDIFFNSVLTNFLNRSKKI